MAFFLTTWKDKRKIKSRTKSKCKHQQQQQQNLRRASSQTSSSFSSSSSPQDSGFGSSTISTVSDHNSVLQSTLSSLSSLSPWHQQQLQQKSPSNQKGQESRSRSTWFSNKSNSGTDSRSGSSISTLETSKNSLHLYPHQHSFSHTSSSISSPSSYYPLSPMSPFSAHYERHITPPLMSRSPASSSARFKAALSRLLLPSRKEDQHYFPITTSTPCRASAVADTLTRTRPNAISSLEVASGGSHQVDLNRFSGSNIQQQQQQQQQLATQSPKKQKKLFHRRHPLLTIKTSSTAPPSVLSPLSPLSPFPSSNGVAAANAVIPIPTDPTAPACFPGMGPVDFALKSQQLQQFQPSSRRSSLTPSLTPSLTRATSSMSPTMASGRHLIPHHHHDLHLGGAMSCVSTAHDAMSSLPSALMLRRGSVESMMSLNSLGGSHSAHLLRRGSVESMMSLNSLHGRPSSQIFRRGSVESFNSPPSSLWNPHENQLRASSSEWTNDEQRRSSISARSMDEMEVVVTSFRNGGVHPFARPAAAVQHHPFTSNERESGESEEEVDMPATLKTHHSIGEAAAALAMMAPSIKAHLPQIEEKVATASSNMTKSSLGQEHDISTMFQVGQLPTPLSSPMA